MARRAAGSCRAARRSKTARRSSSMAVGRKLALGRYAGGGGSSPRRWRRNRTSSRARRARCGGTQFDDSHRHGAVLCRERWTFHRGTAASWRVYDFFWILHTMDYAGRDNFNDPLIVTIGMAALWLSISGIEVVDAELQVISRRGVMHGFAGAAFVLGARAGVDARCSAERHAIRSHHRRDAGQLHRRRAPRHRRQRPVARAAAAQAPRRRRHDPRARTGCARRARSTGTASSCPRTWTACPG